jgi:hypothetical protein
MVFYSNKIAITTIETLIIFFIAVAVRLISLEHEPITDELYHVLAAQSWMEDGSLRIGEGEYTRSYFFTILLGFIFSVFGNDLTVARMISVVAGSFWVAVVFVWLKRTESRPTAWIAALFLATAAHAIFLSQYIRFYALHGLLFFAVSISWFSIVTQYRKLSIFTIVSLFLSTIILFSLAVHLQVTTLIGTAGLIAWTIIFFHKDIYSFIFERIRSQDRKFALSVLVAVSLSIMLVIISWNQILYLFDTYRYTALWSQGADFLFYHRLFSEQYPTLWSLFPLAALIVLGQKNTIGLFSLCVFCVAIAFHSFAGMKAERFIFYVMPFFFIIWSVTIVELAGFVKKFSESFNKQLVGRKLTHNSNFILSGVYSVLIGGFFIINNPGLENTLKIILNRPVSSPNGKPLYWEIYNTNWTDASDKVFKSLAAQASVVVTTQGLHSLYFLGDYDFDINATRLSDLPENMRSEFQIDPRTGRQIISTAESLKLVIECFPDGLIVAHRRGWEHPGRLNHETASLIKKLAQPIPLPEKWNLIAYKWEHSVNTENQKCGTLWTNKKG